MWWTEDPGLPKLFPRLVHARVARALRPRRSERYVRFLLLRLALFGGFTVWLEELAGGIFQNRGSMAGPMSFRRGTWRVARVPAMQMPRGTIDPIGGCDMPYWQVDRDPSMRCCSSSTVGRTEDEKLANSNSPALRSSASTLA